jgi:hypothetical protein
MKKNTGNKSTSEILRQKAKELPEKKLLSTASQFLEYEMLNSIHS